MDNDIKTFVEQLKENTGVEFSVFGESGENINGGIETVNNDFVGVFSDIVLKRTLFRIKYKSKVYICKINGSTKVERTYAYLISELAEKSFSKGGSLSKEDFFKYAIFGDASYYQLEKYTKKYNLTDKSACVMLIDTEKGRTAEVINILANYSSDDCDFCMENDEEQCVLIKFSDEATGEYHSFNEYADFLWQSIYEETGMSVKIFIGGTVKPFSKISQSFSQALSAERMGKAIGNFNGVHSFKEFMSIKMIEDLPKNKLNEYLEVLLDEQAKEIFEDKEMISTAEEFLENSLNISETSRKLFLHRNTLTYRLDKIEKATGLNIRKFSDAVTFRIIIILTKLAK